MADYVYLMHRWVGLGNKFRQCHRTLFSERRLHFFDICLQWQMYHTCRATRCNKLEWKRQQQKIHNRTRAHLIDTFVWFLPRKHIFIIRHLRMNIVRINYEDMKGQSAAPASRRKTADSSFVCTVTNKLGLSYPQCQPMVLCVCVCVCVCVYIANILSVTSSRVKVQ